MIDSENKRRSVGSHWTTQVYPVPDGSLDQGDRQQVAWLYRGILATLVLTVFGNARAVGVMRVGTSSLGVTRSHPDSVAAVRSRPQGTVAADE